MISPKIIIQYFAITVQAQTVNICEITIVLLKIQPATDKDVTKDGFWFSYADVVIGEHHLQLAGQR